MDLFQPHLSKVRVPSTYDSVYKDECVYSFDTPVSSAPNLICCCFSSGNPQ